MKSLVRFTLIVVIVFAAMLLTLMVAGVFDSGEFWSNMTTVLKFVGIFFVTSLAIMFVANKK